MALSAGTAFLEVLPISSKFGSALNSQIQPQLQKTEAGLSRFKGVASAAFAVVGVAAIKFGADSIKAFQESQVVLSQLQNVISKSPALLGETTDAFQAQATALQNLTGVQDEEILSADTQLARFNLTGDTIRSLIPIVLDYAQATGKEVPASAELVGKALLGNTRALKEIGINYHTTGNAATDLANIMDLLKAKVGGAAEAFGKTSQGKMAIFAAKIDDIKEKIGEGLTPALDSVVGTLSHVADAASSSGFSKFLSIANWLNPAVLLWRSYGMAVRLVGDTMVAATPVTDKYREAQKSLQQQIADFGPKSAEGQAAIAHLRAQLEAAGIHGAALDADIQAIIDDAKNLPKSVDPATASISGLATASHTAFGDVHLLVWNLKNLQDLPSMKGWQVTDAIMKAGRESQHSSDNVKTLRTQIVLLPNGKEVKITLPRLSEVRASLRALKSQVDAIAGTYGITYVISYKGFKEQRLAKGGIINEPVIGIGQRTGTKYTIGEDGPEEVRPLGKGKGGAQPLGGGGGGGGGGSRTVVIQIDRREIARAVIDQGVWDR